MSDDKVDENTITLKGVISDESTKDVKKAMSFKSSNSIKSNKIFPLLDSDTSNTYVDKPKIKKEIIINEENKDSDSESVSISVSSYSTSYSSTEVNGNKNENIVDNSSRIPMPEEKVDIKYEEKYNENEMKTNDIPLPFIKSEEKEEKESDIITPLVTIKKENSTRNTESSPKKLFTPSSTKNKPKPRLFTPSNKIIDELSRERGLSTASVRSHANTLAYSGFNLTDSLCDTLPSVYIFNYNR